MIARPAVVALSCRSCQSTFYRAVLSAPNFRSLALNSAPRPGALATRAFSSGRQLRSDAFKDDPEPESAVAVPDEKPRGRPWFLDVDPPRHPPSDHIAVLPKVPENAPTFLEPLIKYVHEDMGLDEISLLDLRELDPPPALGPNLIMLFGTARSERHLHVSAGRLVRWLRRSYKLDSRADGLIGPGELRTKLRRLRKKAKLMGTNTAIVPGGDNGISTGWICVNFSAEGNLLSESESFDDEGRMSGFGTTHTGTTVVVQCLTDARRVEMDLEALWQGKLKRSLERAMRVRGERVASPAELDTLVASRVQIPTNPAATQWDAMKQASLRRYFSTSARRLEPHHLGFTPQTDMTDVSDGDPETTPADGPNLKTIEREISDLQITGRSFSQADLENTISAIFQATLSPGSTEVQRLALVDDLLLTAEERGFEVISRDVLVSLIHSIVTSPAYGPELQRAQNNFEFLLAEIQLALTPDQVARLMGAYATRHDWDRFWNTFRIPPRFQQRRNRAQYDLAFRAMAMTEDWRMCADALRWVWPEMMAEQPPMYPGPALYDSIKACIMVADPAAESMMRVNPETLPTVIAGKRVKNREFSNMLREVQHFHALSFSVREEESHAEMENPNGIGRK